MLIYDRQCFAAGDSGQILPSAFLTCIAAAIWIRVATCMANSKAAKNFSAFSITQRRRHQTYLVKCL